MKLHDKFIKTLGTVKLSHFPQAHTPVHPSPDSHETCTLPYPTEKNLCSVYIYNVNLTTTQ